MRLCCLWLVLGACGESGSAVPVDAPLDAPIDVPSGPCDYREQRDTSNDDVFSETDTPEMTGVTLGERMVVCGAFDSTHFDGDITVDVDTYVFTVAAETDVLVRIHGAGVETIELVGVDIYTGPNLDQLVGQNTFYGDHGVAAVHVPAGTYELAAFALAGAAIPAAVDYQLTVTQDMPAARCAAVTSGGYVEANDGPDSTGNDMVTIPSGAPPALTAAADTPEPSGLVIEPQSPQRVSGSLADVVMADQYEDKDTFLITTGSANELAVRVDWTTAANLDYLLFEAENPDPIVRAIADGNQGPEVETFSVKPNTAYWLLIGAKVGGALPTTYAASLCGALFVP